MIHYDLYAKRGEDFRQTIRFYEKEKRAADLTGWTGAAQVRESPSYGPKDERELICEMDIFIDGEEGRVTLTIPARKTWEMEAGSYAYDFCMTHEGVTVYYLGGRFTVAPSATEPEAAQ